MADDQIKTDSPFLELGVSGLNRFGNEVAEEWLRDLQGQKGIKVYTEMRDNDPVCGAILFAIKAFCRSVKWYVEPGGSSTDDLEAASFVDSCRHDMSHTWQSFISQCLSGMLPFGWAYHEIVYKQRLGQDQQDGSKKSKFDDGYIGWRKLPVRSASSLFGWQWGPDGSLQAMMQQAPPDYQIHIIPIIKALLFRTDEDKDNPEGRSILRNAYKPWYFKTHIEEFEAIRIERDSTGVPVLRAPSSVVNPKKGDTIAAAARETCLKLVKNLKVDKQEGVLLSSERDKEGNYLYELTLLQSGSGSSTAQSAASIAIPRYNIQIAQTALAEFIMLGVEKAGGSYALSQDKTDYFSLAVTGYLDEIVDVMNVHAIPRLLKLNPLHFDNYPILRHGDVKRVNMEALGNVIQKLAQSGMPLFPSPDGSLEKWVLNALGMPEPKEEGPKADDGAE